MKKFTLIKETFSVSNILQNIVGSKLVQILIRLFRKTKLINKMWLWKFTHAQDDWHSDLLTAGGGKSYICCLPTAIKFQEEDEWKKKNPKRNKNK